MSYICNSKPGSFAPYELMNGTWHKIQNYTVNQSACTITFATNNLSVVFAVIQGDLQNTLGTYLVYGAVVLIAAGAAFYLLRVRKR